MSILSKFVKRSGGAVAALARMILTPNVASSEPGATTGRVPIWWTVLVAAASAYGVSAFGSPLCP